MIHDQRNVKFANSILYTDIPRLNAIAPLRKVRLKSNFAQVETAYRPSCDQLYTYTNRSSLEPDRQQQDRPAACVIAQKNSSATFVLLCFPNK
jgi:hypothetical protein